MKAEVRERHIRGALFLMRSHGDDLPDGMLDGVEEIAADFSRVKEKDDGIDVSTFAQAIRELCNDYGLPVPLPGEGI